MCSRLNFIQIMASENELSKLTNGGGGKKLSTENKHRQATLVANVQAICLSRYHPLLNRAVRGDKDSDKHRSCIFICKTIKPNSIKCRYQKRSQTRNKVSSVQG